MTKCDRRDCNKIVMFPLRVNEMSTVWNFCSQRCSDMFGGINYKLYKVISNTNNYFIQAYDEKDLKEKCEKEKINIITFSIKE